MTIEEYRTKSAEGGFDTTGMSDAEVFLNPKSFQAVGKVEGWNNPYPLQEAWLHNMHRMIDALAEGKSLEDLIATL